jgi:hypothetical protein
MADQDKFTIEHADGTTEVHFVDTPSNGDRIVFTYTSSEKEGGPIYTPQHMPAGG